MLTNAKTTIVNNVMSGYYSNHKQGSDLIKMDLDAIADHSVDLLVGKNKRIDYLEQREADLLIELEDARKLIREQTENKTHVNKTEG